MTTVGPKSTARTLTWHLENRGVVFAVLVDGSVRLTIGWESVELNAGRAQETAFFLADSLGVEVSRRPPPPPSSALDEANDTIRRLLDELVDVRRDRDALRDELGKLGQEHARLKREADKLYETTERAVRLLGELVAAVPRVHAFFDSLHTNNERHEP